jgi:hypothetical protein
MSNRKKSSSRVSFFLIALLVLPLASCYLFQVGEVVQASYLVNVYQGKIENLKDQRAALEEKATKTISLAGIENKIKEMNFVPVKNVKYLSLKGKVTSFNSQKELSLNK